MIASLWILEFYLIYHSKKEKSYISITWIVGTTIINFLETMFLLFSEISILQKMWIWDTNPDCLLISGEKDGLVAEIKRF